MSKFRPTDAFEVCEWELCPVFNLSSSTPCTRAVGQASLGSLKPGDKILEKSDGKV